MNGLDRYRVILGRHYCDISDEFVKATKAQKEVIIDLFEEVMTINRITPIRFADLYFIDDQAFPSFRTDAPFEDSIPYMECLDLRVVWDTARTLWNQGYYN